MLGNYVNTITIIIGCLLGLLVQKGLHEKYKTIIMQAIGLSVLFVGATVTIGGLLDPDSEPVLFIISLVIGGALGELIGIEKALDKLGLMLQNKVGSQQSNIAQGFVTASLLFCVGTMAVIGSLDSGLRGDHTMLYAKSVIDGITAMILASTLGVGVIFSAAVVFIYQGTIILFAGLLEPLLTIHVIREISIIGGILILGIGLSMLEIKIIKTVNLLPAIIVPVFYYLWVLPLIQFIK
ncbi:MAG: DUF554 domain-containing protein [Dethiobacteria bacterium]|nr:DUF554 domain-containing protein [Dethiobacteria bacterium]